MNTENGWIKFYREWLDNPIITKDSEHLAVWVYLNCQAIHTGMECIFNNEKITLKAGQVIFKQCDMAEYLKIDRFKVQRILKCFENARLIAHQTDKRKTLITLELWEVYQGLNTQPNALPLHVQCTSEQETENEKEKRSKREKDKEKEKNKNERMKEYIHPSISPHGETGREDFSTPSGKSLFSSDKENVYIPKTEEELDMWLNEDDGIDEWDKMQLYYRQLHSDQRSVVSDQQLDYDIDTNNESSFALTRPIQQEKKERINPQPQTPSPFAEGEHHSNPVSEANPQIGHAPVPRIFGEANHTEGVHIIKAEPCISSSQRDVYHQPQGCIEFNLGEHLPQATSFEATPQLHCDALHLNKVQHRSEKDLEEFFGLFWQAYPKKVGKGYAYDCFKRIKPSRKLLDTMLEAIAKQKKSDMWKRDKGQYIPNPSTWLNQKRWEDDLGGETDSNPWSSFKLGIEL